MYNKDGSVKYVQVEGGADPGNSGGAVVDTNGNVSAVLVAGDPRSNMRWVIPSEYVIHLLRGRVLKVIPGQAVRSGGIKQPITTMVADPLKRLRQVTAEVWAGQPGKIRAGGDQKPEAVEGDGPHIPFTLAYDPSRPVPLGESHSAGGELSLPPLGEGQVYWFRPHYVAKDGTERWGEAVTLEMGRYPVDPKPAHLAIKLKPDPRPDDARRVEVDGRQAFSLDIEGVGGGGSDNELRAALTDRILSVDPKTGDAQMRLQYLGLKLKDADEDNGFRRQWRGVMEAVPKLRAEVTITKDG